MLFNLLESHKFFCRESKKFVGRWEYGWSYIDTRTGEEKEFGRYVLPLKAKLYFPIAYIKFMWLEFKRR